MSGRKVVIAGGYYGITGHEKIVEQQEVGSSLNLCIILCLVFI